jgi:hypothetical protein
MFRDYDNKYLVLDLNYMIFYYKKVKNTSQLTYIKLNVHINFKFKGY